MVVNCTTISTYVSTRRGPLGFLALRERRLHDERPKLGPQRVETYVLIVV